MKIIDKSNRKNLLIVDGLNAAFRFRNRTTDFYDDYCSFVTSLASSYKAKRVIILGDHGSTWRKDKDNRYKANRAEKRANQTPEEEAAFKEFLNQVNIAFKALSNRYLVLKYKGCEADDIAACIVDNFRDNFEHTWLISTDGDWDLLLDDKVSRFSYVVKKEYKTTTWNKLYGVEDFASVKALCGDKSDNVIGVDGIGEKRAATLISQYGSLSDLILNLPISGSAKFIQNLNNCSKSDLLTNLELVDLLTYYEEALLGNTGDIIAKCSNYFVNGECNEFKSDI